MLLIVIILLVNFIVCPLIDLCLNERVRGGVKITVYLLTLAFSLYVLITARMPF